MASASRHLPLAILETAIFFAGVAALFVCTLWEGGFQPTDALYLKGWRTSATYLNEILHQREITLITRNTTQGYYLDRDQAMGFEYELAKAFADFIGVRLQVELAEEWPEMVAKLEASPTAVIAAGLAIPASGGVRVAFSESYLSFQQHLIVHRDNREVQRVKDLAGRSVHIGQDSSCREMLESLQGEIDFDIVQDDAVTEELLRQVAEKRIEITIAKKPVALLSQRYYPQISVREAISPEAVPLGWAVDPRAEGLLSQINRFFRAIEKDGRLQEIYDRYYAGADTFDFVDLRAYHRRLKSRLPKYQALIQSAAAAGGFDWRLIAAQMYQESHFNPRAKSHAGAYGLMQLTPKIATHFGVDNIYDPEENIRAGVRYLTYLFDYFDEAQGMDRICLALAAYNIGQGHILDARNLAEARQLDPNKWDSLSETLPLLSQRAYYRHAIYGFCRGDEPLAYVKRILLYYDILKYQDMPWVTAERGDAAPDEG